MTPKQWLEHFARDAGLLSITANLIYPTFQAKPRSFFGRHFKSSFKQRFKALCQAIMIENNGCEVLSLKGMTDICDKDWLLLSEALAKNTTIETIILDDTKISEPAFEALMSACAQHPKVTEISLKNAQLTGQHFVGIQKLVQANNPNLKSLDLTGNKLGNRATSAVVGLLNHNLHLEKLLPLSSGLPSCEFWVKRNQYINKQQISLEHQAVKHMLGAFLRKNDKKYVEGEIELDFLYSILKAPKTQLQYLSRFWLKYQHQAGSIEFLRRINTTYQEIEAETQAETKSPN